MCPITVSPLNDISDYWTDTELIQCLDKMERITPGSFFPSNVITDINPCQYEPSNLPVDSWYFVPFDSLKQMDSGFWKEKGDACQIYSDSSIIGWRKTLEFYKGQTPNGHRTGWLMQEYWISCKDPVKSKVSSSLCRFFLSDGDDGNSVLLNKDNKTGQVSLRELELEKAKTETLDVHQEVNITQDDYIANGDFLEVDDLVDPRSSSSSSDNSSCVSMASDGYFDSVAMLQELEREDEAYSQPCYKLSVSRPTELHLSLVSEASPDKENNSPKQPIREEHSLPASTVNGGLSDNPPLGLGDAGASSSRQILADNPPIGLGDAGASSSRQIPGTDRGKKLVCGKTMKKFFCFLAF